MVEGLGLVLGLELGIRLT